MTEGDPLLEEFLQWLSIEKGRAPTTLESYRRDLTRFIGWSARHDLDPTTVREEDLDAYVSEMRLAGPAPATVARAVASLRGWFSFLVDEGHLGSDPSARLRAVRRARSLPKPLAESEVTALLDSVSGTAPRDLRDRALLELLYGTGARVSEAIGITLEALDFDEELIRVTGKGSKQRLVPMGTQLRASLLAYLEPGGRGELARGPRTSRLFLNARGGALTRQGVDQIVRRRAFGAGLARSRVSAHVFRHSCATHMLAHGADIRVVQELLGHVSIATTQIYTAVSMTSLQQAYRNAHPRAYE